MRQTLRDTSPVRRGMRPYAPDGPGETPNRYKESTESSRRFSGHGPDPEKEGRSHSLSNRRHSSQRSFNVGKDDPFGDEEGAEVKYRTLRWW